MLIFIDQPKQIKVIRTGLEDGVGSRAPIGKVMKNSLEISSELRAALSVEEVAEVEDALHAYRSGDEARRRYHALNFPVIMREVLDYFEADATDPERRLIMGSMMEALRHLRKLERQSAGIAPKSPRSEPAIAEPVTGN